MLEVWSSWPSGQTPCLCPSLFSAPSFDYADMPSPLGESENTITVLLRPAQGRGSERPWTHTCFLSGVSRCLIALPIPASRIN